MTERYLVCEAWGHLFTADPKKETITRFVFDTEAHRLIAGDAKWNINKQWEALNEAELADLNDSVVNANSDALEDPESWDLERTDELPDWAEPTPGPTI